MIEWKEQLIEINGNILTVAESMTVRVALESFYSNLVEGGLGDDEHGKMMTTAYIECIKSIRNHLYEK